MLNSFKRQTIGTSGQARYERSLGDVVVLQRRSPGRHCQCEPSSSPHTSRLRLRRPQSVDSQTYELYLKGRYLWGKRTDVSIQKSIDGFQQAIQRDPNYALAYAA